MIRMLLIDGAKYKLWAPQDEEKEFHPTIKEYSKEIFGEEHENDSKNEMLPLRSLE